jgi:serine/threonine-protein kinase
MADFEHGLAELRQAQRLEPLSPMINVQLGVGLYLARRYEDASKVLQSIVAFETAFWPAHFFLGLVFAQQREDGRAFAEMDTAAELSGHHPLTLSGLGHLLGRTGQREKAVEILKELRRRAQTEYIAPDHFALIHLALGDEKLALDRLQETVEERSAYSLWLAVEPRLDPLRDNNGFRAVLRNVFARADATGGG